MKVKDVAKKYGLKYDWFVDFLIEHKIPVTTHLLSGASIDDEKAELYAKVFKGYMAATIGKYPFTDAQQGELQERIGKMISEGISEEKLAEYDAMTDQNEIKKWLRTNKPDYQRIVDKMTYEMVYEIERKKCE